MKIRPLSDRVLVERLDEEEQKVGNIVIPDSAKEKPQKGKIVAVGAGSRNEKGELIALEVKKGDKVLFGKYSGTDVKIDGVEYLIMKESDILAIVE